MTDGEADKVATDVKKTMSAIEGVVNILGPLDSINRQRVVQGAFVVLGESSTNLTAASVEETSVVAPVHPKAKTWMKQSGISAEELDQVFDLSEGSAAVIAAEVKGKSNSEKVIKSYVLAGLAAFLAGGEPTFQDQTARDLCENFGCYDATNHAKYIKEKGNNFVGSKGSGWKLTAPGLKYGAALVKEICSG
jgi:hypothetical protein